MRANQTKISANQVFWMMLITLIVTIALLAFQTTIAIAKQDAWMSMSIGGLFGLFMTLLIVQAGLQYSDQTIVVFIRNIIGKWATMIILLPYFALGMVAVGLNLKEFMTFVHLAHFYRTPPWVLIIIFFLIIMYLTLQGGIEGVGRCAQLIGPCLIATIAFVMIMNYNFLDFHQILPVYLDSGWQGILGGGFTCACLFGQSIVLLMLIPFVDQPQRVRAGAVCGVIFATVFLTASILTGLLLFGPNLSASMLNPTFEFARFISAMDFIENVDSVVVVFWIAGYFITFAMYLFIISYGVSQCLELKSWNIGVITSSIIIVGISLTPIKIHITEVIVRHMVLFTVLIVIHLFVVPAVLWIIGHKRQQQHQQPSQP